MNMAETILLQRRVQVYATIIAQWGTLILAAWLLGDTIPHAFGIGAALYCLMPVVRG